MSRVVVIGAGLAGLTAALRLARAGQSVTLATKGPGGLQLSQGTIDILGYSPERVTRPLEAIASLPDEHPYASIGADEVAAAVIWLGQQLGPELLTGDPSTNLHLPTAVGALRPTALAQPSMVAGDARSLSAHEQRGAAPRSLSAPEARDAHARSLSAPEERGGVSKGLTYAVVGVRQLKDFPADLIAGNLARTTAPDGTRLAANSAWIDLQARPGEADPSPLTYARSMDDEAFAATFARAVAKAAGKGDVVAVPAVLGIRRRGVWQQVQDIVGRPVCEIPLPPPSVPGLRLYEALLALVRAAGVRFIQGSHVTGFTPDGGRVASVTLAAAGGPRELAADAVVFAPGGFESGALSVDSYGTISEPVFGLPLTATDAGELITEKYWGPHPLFEVGVRVDDAGRPVGERGVAHENLYVAGGIIAGAERWRDKSGDGVAVATAIRAADHITGGAR
ncbi:MAG TPA: glycerol-3-phosphate dehydrogenase subunit GlpB [Propionibacterium sp.]|nr:glycerol-3-phosphate dehydrogenase subunit GlpB [Propionibacterium sp.]